MNATISTREGISVDTREPRRTAIIYSPEDLQTICIALEKAYAEQRITSGEFILTLLMMALGLSPIQLVALKVGHFQIKKGYHFVDVLCRRPSDHRKTRKIPLTPQFAPPFELHIKQIVKEYRKAVQKSERIPEAELPIFPARKRGSDSYDYTRQLTVSGVLSELQKVYALLNLPPRLKLSPDSVRRTLARMMAIRDSSPKVFTEWFDYQESQDMRLNSFRHWLWAAWNEQRL